MKIKIRAADRHFSWCVRERADWRCECCGVKFPPHSRGLECSHFYSRRHKATRFHGDNAAAHCFLCHQRLGGDPLTFSAWIESHLGTARAQMIEELHHAIVKANNHYWEEARIHYLEQKKRMILARKDGAIGRLEFESWQ